MDDGLARARAALGEEAYRSAFQEGRAMSRERSVAEAVEVEARGPAAAAEADGPLASLTPAELRVLRLVAAGRTTREIAASPSSPSRPWSAT